MKGVTCNMAWGLSADSHPGTDFQERIIHLPYHAGTNSVLALATFSSVGMP